MKKRDRKSQLEPEAKQRQKADVPAKVHSTVTSKGFVVLICLVLAAAVFAIYAPSFHYGYVAYDDDQYLYENPAMPSGLSAAGILWAFTTFACANWHPLTWISYMLDFQLFGASPGPQHAVNVALHLGAALLLFLAMVRMTRQPWRCALVAVIFALHPLHVESVAWIAERKDVLSTFFSMLLLLCYVRYVAKPSLARYVTVAFLFALSLMAKPMAVTWPFILLLLDFWPLGRVAWPFNRRTAGRLLLEKVPLLAMVAAASVLTLLAQKNSGAVVALEKWSFSQRLANAAVAYLAYIGKAIWPMDLAPFYPPHPHGMETVLVSILVLAGVTAASMWGIRKWPYLTVGWLWYVGMLVPVIGIVQVGSQALADRYTYVPLVGLSIALIWGVAAAFEHRPRLLQTSAVAGIAGLAVLSVLAARQVSFWSDSRTLFLHAIETTQDNHIMENNMGVLLAKEGKSGEAIRYYRESIGHNRDFALAQANLGHELLKTGQVQEALPALEQAVALDPKPPLAQSDLGVALAAEGRTAESEQHLHQYLNLTSGGVKGQSEWENNLALVLARQGRSAEAIARFQQAIALRPDYGDAHANLGHILLVSGNLDGADVHLKEAVRLNPGKAESQADLGLLMAVRGKFADAQGYLEAAVRVAPETAQTQSNLCYVLENRGDPNSAVPHCLAAIKLQPNFADAHRNLAKAYTALGKKAEASQELAAAGEPSR